MGVRPSKKKRLTPGAALIQAHLDKLGINPQALALFEGWDRLLGAEAAKAPAVGLKRGVLYVDVDHSARLHDLTLRKPALLRNLKGFFGGGAKAPPSDIIFRLSREK